MTIPCKKRSLSGLCPLSTYFFPNWVLDTEGVTFYYSSWLLLLSLQFHVSSPSQLPWGYSPEAGQSQNGGYKSWYISTFSSPHRERAQKALLTSAFKLPFVCMCGKFFLLLLQACYCSCTHTFWLWAQWTKKNAQPKYQPCCFCSYLPTSKGSFHLISSLSPTAIGPQPPTLSLQMHRGFQSAPQLIF